MHGLLSARLTEPAERPSVLYSIYFVFILGKLRQAISPEATYRKQEIERKS